MKRKKVLLTTLISLASLLLLTFGGLITTSIIQNKNNKTAISTPIDRESHSVIIVAHEHGHVEAPSGKIDEGKSFSITLKPDTGYSVKSYSIDGGEVKEVSAVKGGNFTIDNLTMGDADMVINATFVANEYTITFKDEDKHMTFNPITVTYDQTITLPSTHEGVIGYTVGWHDSASVSYSTGQTWNVANDIELQATWNPNSYTMTLDANGGAFADGSTSKTESVDYDQSWNFEEEPTRTGYTFKGWHVGNEEIDSSGTSWTKYAENKTIKAKWAVNGSSLNIKDTFELGEYPQTDVTTTLGNALDELVKEDGWTSYNYYASGTTSDFMKWQDVTYDGTKYRGVMITAQRPEETTDANPTNSGSQYNSGYVADAKEIYWFKYEPIKWTVMAKDSDKLTALCNVLLDSQQYYHKSTHETSHRAPYDDPTNFEDVYDGNYKFSDIREWLNTSFYDWAFDAIDKSSIATTVVDNSEETTGSPNGNRLACDNTNDKVFLMSYKEYFNTYGTLYEGTPRIIKHTDYAKSQGAYVADESEAGNYYTRSPEPFGGNEDFITSVNHGGQEDYSRINSTSDCVRPALSVSFDSL